MQVTLRNLQINEIVQVLASFINTKLAFKTAYRIGKILRELERHSEDYNKERDKLIQSFAKKDDKGEYVKPLDAEGKELEGQVVIENMQEFQQKMFELAMEKVSLVLPTTISMADLEVESDIRIEPSKLASLMAMLEPEPEQESEAEVVEVEEVN